MPLTITHEPPRGISLRGALGTAATRLNPRKLTGRPRVLVADILAAFREGVPVERPAARVLLRDVLAQSLQVGSTRPGQRQADALARLERLDARTFIDQPSAADLAEKETQVLEALSAHSPVDTGNLAESWVDGRGQVEFVTPDHGVISNAVPYARINSEGGYTGRNHASYITPSFYMDKAAAATGVTLSWAP